MSESLHPEAVKSPRMSSEELAEVFARGSLESQLAAQYKLSAAYENLPESARSLRQGEQILNTIQLLKAGLLSGTTRSAEAPEDILEQMPKDLFDPFAEIATGITDGSYDKALPQVLTALNFLVKAARKRGATETAPYQPESFTSQELPEDFAERFVAFIQRRPASNIQTILYAIFGTRRVDKALFTEIHEIDLSLRAQGLIAKNQTTNLYYPPSDAATAKQPSTQETATANSIDDKLKEANLFGTSNQHRPASSLNNTTSRRGGQQNKKH